MCAANMGKPMPRTHGEWHSLSPGLSVNSDGMYRECPPQLSLPDTYSPKTTPPAETAHTEISQDSFLVRNKPASLFNCMEQAHSSPDPSISVHASVLPSFPHHL